MEAANSLRFRNALVFLRHQLRSTYAFNPRHQQQCRTNVNTTESPIKKNFAKECIAKFINQGYGDMKNIPRPTPGLLETLEERGFVGQFHGNREEFTTLTNNEVIHIYAGADATASSLHIGHLMVLMPMIHSMLHGHRISLIVGVATARIGDPSGRLTERTGMKDQSLGERTFRHGTDITDQLSTLLKTVINHARERGHQESKIGRRAISSNLQWHRNVSIIDFMQIVGHRSRIGEMMLRKSVSERLKSEEGLSFSEFSYQLIQALDYWHLFSNLGVRLQIGGSDQWGNITAGCDLINRMVNEAAWIDEQPSPALIKNMAKPYGLTVPLLTTSTGEKFSKSTGAGNIWISPRKTPPFSLYQYLLNRPDNIMESWLKYFTLLPISEIKEIMAEQKKHPERRPAQKKLAYELISLLHGRLVALKCIETTAIFFGQTDEADGIQKREAKLKLGLTKSDVEGISARPFWEPVNAERIMGMPLEKALAAGGVAPSNTQARTLLKSGAVSIGPHLRQVKLTDEKTILTQEDLIDGNILLIKVGKNKLHVIRVEDEKTIELAMQEKEDPESALKPTKPGPITPLQRRSARKKERRINVGVRANRRSEQKKITKLLDREGQVARTKLAGRGDFSGLVSKAVNRAASQRIPDNQTQPSISWRR
ncbi:tyrosyl-tRNA synthetase [Orbilia blumenaviensis]|uniref:Tyrosine--tRNA ligase n=1 Tax=Orbilia blumenaviensis TaxID=1796055 RepID=A0AAV9VK15_9PEZI